MDGPPGPGQPGASECGQRLLRHLRRFRERAAVRRGGQGQDHEPGGGQPGAATRLVTRLEDRGLLVRILCQEDRRGIYTELTEAGRETYERARPTHDRALTAALELAAETPELAPLVTALTALELTPAG